MTGAPLYLVSACSSPEQFVAAFRRYIDRIGLFVPIATPLAAGKRGRMAITLVDGGVMLEGDAEVVSSSTRASALYGRIGMTIRFTSPDAPSKTLLEELDKARITLKPGPPSIGPRPAEIPAEPRPTPPEPSGRIDAANALAECVVVGDTSRLRGGRSEILGVPVVQLDGTAKDAPPKDGLPPKAGPKFVIPNLTTLKAEAKPPERPKTGTIPPIVPPVDRGKTPTVPPLVAPPSFDRSKAPSTPPLGMPPKPSHDDTQRSAPPSAMPLAPATAPRKPPTRPPTEPLADADVEVQAPKPPVVAGIPRSKSNTGTQPSAVVPPPTPPARKPRVDPNPTIRGTNAPNKRPPVIASADGDERTDMTPVPVVDGAPTTQMEVADVSAGWDTGEPAAAAPPPAMPRTQTLPGAGGPIEPADSNKPTVALSPLAKLTSASTPLEKPTGANPPLARPSAPITTQPGVGSPAKRAPSEAEQPGFPNVGANERSRELASMRNALDDFTLDPSSGEVSRDDNSSPALVVSRPPVDDAGASDPMMLAPPGTMPRAPAPPKLPERMPRITEPPPVPEESRDTAVMTAADPGADDEAPAPVGPAVLARAAANPPIDPLAPTMKPAVSPFAAKSTSALAEADGDWTMTPDASEPSPVEKPDDGDWTISPTAGGWTEPSAPKVRVADPEAGGPPIASVASEVKTPVRSSPARYEEDVPKVQVDPTLIEPLPDVTKPRPQPMPPTATPAHASISSGGWPSSEVSGVIDPSARPGSGAWPASASGSHPGSTNPGMAAGPGASQSMPGTNTSTSNPPMFGAQGVNPLANPPMFGAPPLAAGSTGVVPLATGSPVVGSPMVGGDPNAMLGAPSAGSTMPGTAAPVVGVNAMAAGAPVPTAGSTLPGTVPMPPSGAWPATEASNPFGAPMPGAPPPGFPPSGAYPAYPPPSTHVVPPSGAYPAFDTSEPPRLPTPLPGALATNVPGAPTTPPDGWPLQGSAQMATVAPPDAPVAVPGSYPTPPPMRPSQPYVMDPEQQMRLMGLPHQRMVTDAGTGFFRESTDLSHYQQQYGTGDNTAMTEVGKRRRIIIIVVSAVLAVTFGIILLMVIGGGKDKDKDEPPPPPKHQTPNTSASVTPADAAVEAKAPPPVVDAAVAEPVADAAPARCFAKVSSVPPGADVSIDDGPVAGQTPGRIEVPCGTKVKLTFKKAQLGTQSRFVTGTSDDIDVPKVTLAAKQIFTLRVSSVPSGASITVNGKAMGATPAVIKLVGFEPATIVLAKDGYEPDTERVTPKQNNGAIRGTLKKKK